MAVTSTQFVKEATISEFNRKYFNEPMNFDTCFLKQVFKSNGKSVVINSDSIIMKYRDELAQYLTKRVLTDQEYRRYKYNPKIFSYDTYGTTELWFLVLTANELYSATEFDTSIVYYYTPSVFRVLAKIQELESPFIDYNEAEITDTLKS